jgi:hypothetical protein
VPSDVVVNLEDEVVKGHDDERADVSQHQSQNQSLKPVGGPPQRVLTKAHHRRGQLDPL